jgi:hypothetical protein
VAAKQRSQVDSYFIGCLLRLNGQIIEALQWSIENKEQGCAAKLRLIAESFSDVLAGLIDKEAEDFIRRKKIRSP